MTLKGHFLATAFAAGIRPTAAERAKGRLMRAPDGHDDDEAAKAAAREAAEREAAEKEAADKEAAEREAAEAEAARKKAEADGKTADAEALQKQLEELQEKLKQFEDIDPEQARKNASKLAELEKQAKDAAAAAKKAEKEKAQAENDVEKLRKIQAEEHEAEVNRIVAERDEAKKEVTTLQERLNKIQLENAFNGAKFIADETILTGAKAQRLFGDHVDIEDGSLVVYDAPRGAAKRAKVMDSKGNPLPFNDAIAKVINADPDKDALLKSKTKPGAGSKTTDGKPEAPSVGRHEKLAKGLQALREKHSR